MLKKPIIIVCLFALVISGMFYRYKQELNKCAPHKEIYSNSNDQIPIEHINALDALEANSLVIGMKEMKKHKLVIAGITRDNALDSAVTFKHIELIGSGFKDYRVIVFENDSKDGTKEALTNWQKNNPKVRVDSIDYGITKRPNIKFLANARNHYLNILANNHEYDDFDMVMIVDMDMSYGIDPRGVQQTFSKIDKWDAVCANGVSNMKGKMYDMFAFYNKENQLRPKDGAELFWSETENRKLYPIYLDLVPVYSCFGGLAFYKRTEIDGCRYDSIDDDCEHLYFHDCLAKKNGGKMFLNPALVVKYSHFHFNRKIVWSRFVYYLFHFFESKSVCY